MLQVHRPEEAFQRVFPRIPPTRISLPPPGRSKYNRPCRYGATCAFLKMGECFYHHDSNAPPQYIQLMTKELSDPVTLPAFGAVDTTFQWYGVHNVETLASFNVLEGGRLAVPGLPPVLRPPDSDIIYTAPDAHLPPATRSQTSKFNPLLRALHILQPDLDPSSLSIITTAGCLRRITSFLSHNPSTERLDIEFRHGTLFVGRWEDDSLPQANLGYGKQFEEGVQRYGPGLKETVSSHIVARYGIGGLRMGVQVEVDAFKCNCHSLAQLLSSRTTPRANRRLSSGRFDVLSDVEDEDEGSPRAYDGVLRVGTQLPLSCAVEIKTRVRHTTAGYPYIPQLYFQQTPRVFLATRDGQKFRKQSMRMLDESEKMKHWEKENQVLLGRVVALLKRLKEEAERRAGCDGVCKMGLVLSGGKDGEAVLYGREGKDLVSDI